MVPVWIPGLLKLLQEGSTNSWWGLSCPHHCRGADLGSLFAAFLLGVLLTLGACWYISFSWRTAGYPRATPEKEPSGISVEGKRRLASYAH